MKGVELKHNNIVISVPVVNYSVSIIVEKVRGKRKIIFSGVDFQNNKSFTWYDTSLNVGDTIQISIKDIGKESPDIQTSIEEISEEELTQIQLQNFRELEQSLIKRGVL